jgi:hypothetical protein
MSQIKDAMRELQSCPGAYAALKMAVRAAGVRPEFGDLVAETTLANVQFMAASGVPLRAITQAVEAEYARARIDKLKHERRERGLSDPPMPTYPAGDPASLRNDPDLDSE